MDEQFLLNPDNGWQNLQAKLTAWYENLVLYLPNFLLALLTLAIFLLLGRFLSKLVRRITLKLKLPPELAGLFATFSYLLIGGIGVFAALGILNLNKTVTSLLAGAGIIGLFLSLAFQNVAINVLSGAVISVRRPIAVGDVIVHIPNKEMIEQPVANYTKYGIRRIEFSMRISYNEDPEYVRSVALQALEAVPDRLKAYAPEFYFEEFEADALEARARFWIAFARDTLNRNYKASLDQGVVGVHKAFKDAGITIPPRLYHVTFTDYQSNIPAGKAGSGRNVTFYPSDHNVDDD